MKHLLSAALVASALIGGVACSDGTSIGSKVGQTEQTTADNDPGGNSGSVPVIPGVKPECQAIYQAMAGAAQAMSGASDAEQATAMFAALVDAVPAELKDDAKTFSDAYSAYLNILLKYQGDPTKAMADPTVIAALSNLSSEEVQTASDNLSNYMNVSCQTGS